MLPPLSTRLQSARLVLTPPRTADVPELRAALRRNAAHLRPWSAAPAPGEDPASLTAVSKAVLRHRREWKRSEAYVFLLMKREVGADESSGTQIIGRVALTGIMRGVFQNAYLGYWIDHENQGEGLMTEAVEQVVTFALDAAKLHRVQAAVMPNNSASIRVLEKLGFRREGFAERYLRIAGKWEGHLLYAITDEDWRRQIPT